MGGEGGRGGGGAAQHDKYQAILQEVFPHAKIFVLVHRHKFRRSLKYLIVLLPLAKCL